MKTISLSLGDDLDAALDMVSARQGVGKEDLAADVLRRFVDAEQLRSNLQDPEIVNLYRELADEDVALAEEGIADYKKMLDEADRV